MLLAENVKPLERRKRAVIYCRVSSEKQKQDGESLEYQEEKCRQWAEAQGIQVLTVLSPKPRAAISTIPTARSSPSLAR